MKDIFIALENLLEEKVPERIIWILKTTGFDRKCSLSEITADCISSIEEFMNNYSHTTSEIPQESIYSKIRPFKLLPGDRKFIENIPKYIEQLDNTETTKWNLSEFSFVLKCLIDTAQENSHRNIKCLRYSKTIQAFATYLYLMCGRSCYDTLCANLPIPQSNTVGKKNEMKFLCMYVLHSFIFTVTSYLIKNKVKPIEGELRCKELSEYLDKLNTKKYVWLCEDGSGINASMKFDPITNQIIGAVLPINQITGIPESFTFNAKSAEEMQKISMKPVSTLVYLVLAQPLMENAPPFVLQIFGTNNRFRANDVVNRWSYTINELER